MDIDFFVPIGAVQQYEVLDTDKDIRKCHSALERNGTAMNEMRFVGIETLSELLPSTDATIQKHGMRRKDATPAKERLFDDVAMAAITALLNRKEFKLAMDKNWGSEIDARTTSLQGSVRRVYLLISYIYSCIYVTIIYLMSYISQLLVRCRLAALNGMSVRLFIDRLLPVLLREVAMSNDNE